MQPNARSETREHQQIVRVSRYGLTRCPTCRMFIRVAGADHQTRCACCGVALTVQVVAH